MHPTYPYLHAFARCVGIAPEKLVSAFAIEREFHERILSESSPEKRRALYADVYPRVHAIYGKTGASTLGANPKDRTVKQFRKELEGRSILDVGCGEGHFLVSVSRLLDHGELLGLDISIPSQTQAALEAFGIRFVSADIIRFSLDRQFDVAFSDQVIEHIAPADLPDHLASVHHALKPGGLLIINMPHRCFGPCDVTRIVDFTYTGRTPACGTHLNESTYAEMIAALKPAGFEDFRTVVPIPRFDRVAASVRIPTAPLLCIEKSRAALRLMHAVRWRGRCMAKFGVILIARKVHH